MGAALLCTACFNDNDATTELSNESAITAFQLGGLNRSITVKSSSGADSTYTLTVTAANYPFTIDQERNLIFNPDSLPYNTNLTRALVSNITGLGAYSIVGLDGKETTLSTTDSLDFTQPRTLVVRSLDGATTRRYQVEVRVHREEGDSVRWRQMTTAQWNQLQATPYNGQSQTLMGRRYWIDTTSGWALRSQPTGGVVSTEMTLPSATDARAFGTMTLAALPTRTNTDLYEMLLYGVAGNTALIYKQYVDAQGQTTQPWMDIPRTSDNTQAAPTLQQAQLLSYDDGFLLVGINAAEQAQLLYSADRGRTWKLHPSLRLPQSWTGVAQIDAHLDADQNLWLRINNQIVWRGHLNRLAWQPVATSFQ